MRMNTNGRGSDTGSSNSRRLTVAVAMATTAGALATGAITTPAYASTNAALPVPTSRVATTSADANARIATKLPLRSISAAIGSNYSINVVDAMTGEAIYSRNSSTPLLTASNMKLVTAVSALTVLGPNTRMATKVYSVGKGAIALVGGGDTALGPVGVRALAKKALAAIRANPALAPGTVATKPHRPATCRINGRKVTSTAKHPCPLIPGATRSGKLKIYVDESMYPAPTVPAGWRGGYEPSVVRPVRPLAMDGHYVMDAGADTANFMASFLRSKGLSAGYAGKLVVSAGSPLIGTRVSATVAEQVKYMLQVSENNVAEMLYRNVAIAKGYVGNWAGGARAAMDVMTSLGVPTAGLALTSGSGVSRNDR
ncbi:MAG: D-alanyl-D-alanine carboxypeptidase, partial [Actinomycetes bacterium]